MFSACSPPSLRGLEIAFLLAGFIQSSADRQTDQFNPFRRNRGFEMQRDGEAVRKFFRFIRVFRPLAGTAEEVASLLVLYDVAHSVIILHARFRSIRGTT